MLVQTHTAQGDQKGAHLFRTLPLTRPCQENKDTTDHFASRGMGETQPFNSNLWKPCITMQGCMLASLTMHGGHSLQSTRMRPPTSAPNLSSAPNTKAR
eukprot:4134991-Amphidinium_carterae.1